MMQRVHPFVNCNIFKYCGQDEHEMNHPVIKIHGHVTLQLIVGLIQGQLMCPKLVPKYW